MGFVWQFRIFSYVWMVSFDSKVAKMNSDDDDKLALLEALGRLEADDDVVSDTQVGFNLKPNRSKL